MNLLESSQTSDRTSINPYVEKMNHPRIESDLDSMLNQIRGKYAIVDLGCGNGHFLQGYLTHQPNAAGLGIERRYKRVFKTAQKIERVENKFSRVAQMEISEFFEKSPRQFWDEIWFQFPDPWPKMRHEKNRMVNHDTFRQIYECLKPQGKFCFRSDCRRYWEFLQMANIQYEYFPIVRSQIGDLFVDAPTTLFQQKFLSISTPIYSLEFRK